MRLNEQQVAYKQDFVKKAATSRLMKADTSTFCFNPQCGRPGDVREPNGMFDAVIPSNGRRLILDDIKLIWFCSSCASVLRAMAQKDAEENF